MYQTEEWAERIRDAATRIRGHVTRTPMIESTRLSEQLGMRVFLKLENQQVTGSFKARGALHKLLCLSPAERSDGIITASSGNHGAAVAYGANRLGCPATVYVPTCSAQMKRDAIAKLGAKVRVEGADCVETESIARAAALAAGLPYIPPYNDEDVMAGQGTVAVEMLQDCPELSAIFCIEITGHIPPLRPKILMRTMISRKVEVPSFHRTSVPDRVRSPQGLDQRQEGLIVNYDTGRGRISTPG